MYSNLFDLILLFMTIQIKLFCLHPVKQIMMENKLEVHKDKTLKEAVEIAYKVQYNVFQIVIYTLGINPCIHGKP